ncbi:MAG: response regulator transcription factor [Pseudomonadota bacterium]
MSGRRYQCLVVDDEELARELLETHLAHFDQFELVASCASAIEASRYLNTRKVDLLFLDIEMPVLKGTDFYQGLKEKPAVIFTTAYRDYAVDGFELAAVDYLLKPIVFSRFFKAVERFLAARIQGSGARLPESELSLSSPQPDHVFIRVDRKDVKLTLADVIYVQGLKDYVKIHTDRDVYIVKSGVAAICERLGDDFVRVHRSYIVNRNQVTAISGHDVELGRAEVPIGDRYREAALARLGSLDAS